MSPAPGPRVRIRMAAKVSAIEDWHEGVLRLDRLAAAEGAGK